MPTSDVPLRQRVESAYAELSAAASDLNAISDDLGKCVAEIEEALKKLNVGVSAWVCISRSFDTESGYGAIEELGYAKWARKWGFVLRTKEGYPDDVDSEGWVFNEAPRPLRISAIEKIPELLVALSEEANKMTADVLKQLGVAKEVTKALTDAARDSSPRKRIIARGATEVKQ